MATHPQGSRRSRFSAGTAAIALMVCLLIQAKAAVTHYVDVGSVNPVPPYISWDTAASVIQDAVDAAAPGDTVLVSFGVYTNGGRSVGDTWDSNRVAIEKPITLESFWGPAATIIQGSAGGRAVRCVHLGAGATLSGFTLTGGATPWFIGVHGVGGGVRSEPGAVVTNCVITGNSAESIGGGAYGGILYNCSLSDNSAVDRGGGAAEASLYNCSIVSNRVTGAYRYLRLPGGGGVYGGTLYNCLVSRNSATGTGGVPGRGGGVADATLYNCTVMGNSAIGSFDVFWVWGSEGGGAAGSTLYNCTVTHNASTGDNKYGQYDGGGVAGSTVYNSIVYYNTAANGPNYSQGYHPTLGVERIDTRLHFSCTTPFPPDGAGNIPAPPLFRNAAVGDFRLTDGSPCVDAGADLTLLNVGYEFTSTDMLGNTRFLDGDGDGQTAWDMGAYELTPFERPRFAAQCRFRTDGFEFTITGEPDTYVRVERTRNLVEWEHVVTVRVTNTGHTLIDLAATSNRFLFYRAVSVP